MRYHYQVVTTKAHYHANGDYNHTDDSYQAFPTYAEAMRYFKAVAFLKERGGSPTPDYLSNSRSVVVDVDITIEEGPADDD